MKSLLIPFFIGTIFSCNLNNSSNTDDNFFQPYESMDSGRDTSEPPIIAETGTWNVSEVSSVNDTCSINNYQNVAEMIPPTFTIVESNISSFKTEDTSCEINQSGYFTCNAVSAEESALGGSAKLLINTIMNGKYTTNSSMVLDFDVTIDSCSGAGCLVIEMALSFPCPVLLSAKGEI
tara:strand:- start:3281 stop:3814 length:534 start_codon:yes stop_codon:yes gene_type:complete